MSSDPHPEVNRDRSLFWCANGACRRRPRHPQPGSPVAYPMLDAPEVSIRQPASGLFIYFHRECAPAGSFE